MSSCSSPTIANIYMVWFEENAVKHHAKNMEDNLATTKLSGPLKQPKATYKVQYEKRKAWVYVITACENRKNKRWTILTLLVQPSTIQKERNNKETLRSSIKGL